MNSTTDHLHVMQEPTSMHSEVRLDAARLGQRRGIAFRRRAKTVLLTAAMVGGFYLLREHWSHVADNWIYLLLLACPLMHLFHGHGGHGGHASPSSDRTHKKD